MHNKVKITKKAALESTPCLLSVGYCRIQTLLQHLRPFAYSAGVHGWLCDYFDVADGVVISTGYAPIGLAVPYELCEEYEKAAQKLFATNPFNKAQAYVHNVLLSEFVEKAKKAIKKGDK